MFEQLVPFLTSVAIGLLIGVERERSKNREGTRSILGARTLPMVALLGALLSYLDNTALLVIGAAFVTGLILMSEATWSRERGGVNVGNTTAVAGMLTFILGFLAYNDGKIAVILAVVVFVFLSIRSQLHNFVRTGISKKEMSAVLTFLTSAFVILPLLPNSFVDPWRLIHPTRIWLLFVIIAGVEFCSYIALRNLGSKWGVLFSGLLGGLVSATATTLALARRFKSQSGSILLLSSGIVLAEVSSLILQLIVLAVIAPDVFLSLYLYLAVPAAVGLLIAFGMSIIPGQVPEDTPVDLEKLESPISLKSTLSFALLISAGLILIALAARWLGSVGALLTSALGGIASLRVVTFSVSELASTGDLLISTAALSILIAMTTNMLMKLVIVWRAAGSKLTLLSGFLFVVMLASGIVVFLSVAP